MSTKVLPLGKLSFAKTTPINNLHAISVSFPAWKNYIDFYEDNSYLFSILNIGYPRYVVHYRVKQLAKECLKQLEIDTSNNNFMLLLTREACELCRNAIYKQRAIKSNNSIRDDVIVDTLKFGKYDVHIIVYPMEDAEFVRKYWTYTGVGISTRFADFCLNEVGIYKPDVSLEHNVDLEAISLQTPPTDHLPADQVDKAKQLIQQRLVNVLHATYSDADDGNTEFTRQHPSALALNENNVYLYPCGMNAIFHLNRLFVLGSFVFTDSHKILELVGTDCLFFGYGSEEEIDELEKILNDPTQDPIISIFCELPTNPLLMSPNVRRLSALADKFNIPLLIDATVGGFSNSQLLPFVDVMIVSLSKLFSGECDLLAGSLIVNTTRPHGARLQHALNVDDGTGRPGYEDTMWWQDVLVLERNSRTFMERDARINHTAEIVCDYLYNHPKVAKFYYPKYVDREIYDSYKKPNGGYGSSRAFYDALLCAKGTTFGTNFTMVCAYTTLNHYKEPERAQKYNLPMDLIRISIGLEEPAQIIEWLDIAFAAVSDKQLLTQ
ncbi:pyridoxal phosphate-dependent transferase [Syncephalis fuscata]|nr:pyridoxal phosphate-dependent transferase [Syncephalis fuscata]